jgi:hypothetical protein
LAKGAARGDWGVSKIARVAGRIVLWACVLLLLIRGIESVLSASPKQARRVQTVTVTVPSSTQSKMGGR